ncbi:hypothetical protein OEZ86_014154 [Tetradesmus obliquus]|nr:hypothetical protein OEZ86_014154 [Tetradesmus obliquus]
MEGADDLLQPEELGEDQPVHPAVLTPKASAVRAVKKNDWALRSVLKVFVVKVDPNYAQPWQKCPQRSSSGSAFVLDTEQRIIITNAHVVANAVTVYVRRPGNPKKWRSQVTCMGKQSDLALLTVPEDAFWGDDLRPLVFLKEVPELQSPISVAGYPVGGDSLSITKGIVSRVSMVRYSQSGRLLGIQIDAAINPGNSGGPAFADMTEGTVAGVAFSKNVSSSTDNIGYIIPFPIVEHFLSEYRARGVYQGVVSPGFYTQPMENPAQQQYLQVPEGASGCIVVKLEPSTEAAQHLQLADVILEVEGEPIAADESVQFRDDERVDYSHVISLKHVGDNLNLKILRQGQVRDVCFTLHKQQHLVGILHEVDCLPSYYVAGGLVFAPLSLPCMEAVYGSRKWRTLAPISVLQAFVQQRTSPSQQVVILVQVLSHEINHGYKYSVLPVETFNGAVVHNMAHLAAMVDGCDQPYLNFGLEGGRFVTLDRQQVIEHTPHILKINNIPSDRSEDLLGEEAAAAAAAGAEAAAAAAAAAAGSELGSVELAAATVGQTAEQQQ